MVKDDDQGILRALDARVPDPRAGLPEDIFLLLSRFMPLVNVDLLIQDERNRTLLTWRDDEFHGPGWHVPGGIIRYKETAEARIRATARHELAADVEFDPVPIAVEQCMEPERRERGHYVALAYRCRLTGPPGETLRFTGGVPRRGQWAWHESCPPNLLAIQAAYRRFF
jgi:colanic acid biosynthesis protein WcaH